ncbi:hypothetical protein V6N13_108361 [Hibiscus sabdariffa]
MFLTVVYASPYRCRQNGLWPQLLALMPTTNYPWILGGDFNVILHSNERMGGAERHVETCSQFGQFISDVGLHDLGFQGPRYTWKRGTLHQRLDRCLSNDAWLDL